MAKPACSDCRFYRAKSIGMKDAHGVCVAAPWSIDIPDPEVHWCGEFLEAERRQAMLHETARPISPVVYEGARPLPTHAASEIELVRVPRQHAELVPRLLIDLTAEDDRMPAR